MKQNWLIKTIRKINEFFDREELSINMMCANMSYDEYIEELKFINKYYCD